MSHTHRRKVLGLLALLLLLGGCRNDGATIKLAPVTGMVTFKNKPVSAAEIYFIPDTKKGNDGEQGTAILAADGTFTITTYQPKGLKDGVAPGAYKVVIGLGRRSEKELNKFRSVQTTPLTIDVPEDGLEDVVVDLDKGRVEVKGGSK